MRIKPACFLLACAFATGCGSTATLHNPEDGTALEASVRALHRKTTRAEIETASKSPAAVTSPATGGEKAPAVARKPDGGEEDKDSAPSPHDIDLPVPEIEDALEAPPKPTEAPKAFSYDVPVVRNAIVERWIAYFTGPGRAHFAVWLRRGGKYIGLFRKILKENGLPQDLAYLPLIESGFHPKARSVAGAVGPWQFMPATARRMGLKINYYVDERRHPIKSTRAAVAYLSMLYEEFGDWHLALAGYNAGEYRIMRALRRSKKKDYWSLAATRRLPNETRNYVAKYLAGMFIAKNPEVFGFAGIEYEPPWNYRRVALPHGASLRTISRMSRVPLQKLRRINAELRTSVTPPKAGYSIFLPEEKAEEFIRRLASLPRDYPPAPGHYKIRRGDTFGAIAQRYKISLHKLMDMNAHLDPKRLRPGTKIRLPKTRRQTTGRRLASAGERPGTHVARRGESLWTIARKYAVSTQELMRRNPGINPKRMRVGTKVRLPAPKRLAAVKRAGKKKPAKSPIHHLVSPGENISIIAKRYGISTKSLLAWNRLRASDKIFPGNKLVVHR